VLHDFPMAKYSQYIELKERELQLEAKDFSPNDQLFGLKQKEDEHSRRMDRERADLEGCSAKRRCFDASTDDGIPFSDFPQTPCFDGVLHTLTGLDNS